MRVKKQTAAIALTILCLLFTPKSVQAATDMRMDGSFGEWQDKPFVRDPIGDEEESNDITMVKWYPDIQSGNLFIYAERLGSEKKGGKKDWNFVIAFTGEQGVKNAYITYHPPSQQVNIGLYDPYGYHLWGAKGKWGEDKNEGKKVEFYIPLCYLTGSTTGGYEFTMTVQSGGDRAPDRGGILISTASTFPLQTSLFLAGTVIVGYSLVRRRKRISDSFTSRKTEKIED